MVLKRIHFTFYFYQFSYIFSQLFNNIYHSNFIKVMNRKRTSMALAQNSTISSLIARLQSTEDQLHILTSEVRNIRNELVKFKQSGDNSVWDDCSQPDCSSKKTCYTFTKENDFVVVFTDGACENNGRPNAKAGIGVWFGPNHPLNISCPVDGRATNNTAEIQACIQAVKTAHTNGITKLRIKTDSEFVINSMTKWVLKWRSNNWKVASGGDVKNKEDFVILDSWLKKLEVVWEHVDAHVGIEGNEGADSLAKAGAKLYSRQKIFY